MGDIADMILDSTLCKSCGVYIGDGAGTPINCAFCLKEIEDEENKA